MSIILKTLPTNPVLNPDNTFDLSVYVSVSGSRTTGLDYGLSMDRCTLLSRDISNSLFPDLISNDLSTQFGNTLFDMGGSVNNVNLPIGDGTWLVANYHFRVDGILQPIVNPIQYSGTLGWAGPAPLFNEQPFDQFQGSAIIVPEPLGWVILGVMLVLYFGFWIRSIKRRR